MTVTDPDAGISQIRHSANTYKGGKSPDGAVLTGLIEPTIVDKAFDKQVSDYERFIAKRRIGGTDVNGKVIGGWKEVPCFLDWDSTYRYSEWKDNFDKFEEILNEDGISGLIETGDLNEKQENHNHAVCTFLNSYFQLEGDRTINVDELLKVLKFDGEVQDHAENIYFNTSYMNLRELVEFGDVESSGMKKMKVKLDGQWKTMLYSDFNIRTYEQLVDLFFDYLDFQEQLKVRLLNMTDVSPYNIDPRHRWTSDRSDVMTAKTLDLQESRFSEMSTAFISLTTYQDKKTGEPIIPDEFQEEHRGPLWFEAMERLQDARLLTVQNLRQAANEMDKQFDYLWVVECHKSGFPHIHILVFGDMADYLQCDSHDPDMKDGKDDCDKRHRNPDEEWSERYDYECQRAKYLDRLEIKNDLGHNGIAVDIAVRPAGSDEAMRNVANYMMKYVKKNLGEIDSKYTQESLDDKDWGEIVFNACMWASGYRTWGASREVSSVMKRDRNDSGKEFNNLGGELSDKKDKSFDEIVESKADRQLKWRLKKREQWVKSIKERKQS